MSSLGWKRTVVVAAAALTLGGATLGVAGVGQAQATPALNDQQGQSQERREQFQQRRQELEQRHEQYLDALANKLGVSTDQLKKAMADARSEVGFPDHKSGPQGEGWRGGPGPQGEGGRGGMFFGQTLGVAAQAMDLDVDVLRQELVGKSLADVAKAHNVDPKVVADALKAHAAEQLDKAVEAKRLTADQASQMKQQIDQRIDELMTRQLSDGGPRR
jgi:hypothetical protein